MVLLMALFVACLIGSVAIYNGTRHSAKKDKEAQEEQKENEHNVVEDDDENGEE